jgi:FkbM family methyltransferase
MFESLGYNVRKRSRLGGDPFIDMARLAGVSPVVFDVGANIGQSVALFRKYLPAPRIHAFEPGASTFATLKAKYGHAHDVKLNSIGLGSRSESREFIENSTSRMSSFLEPGRDCFGEIVNRETRELASVDSYAETWKIQQIEILKTDTQGFDLEVLKGSERMLAAHRIHMIFVELTFCQLYQGAPRVDELLRFILDRGFEVVSMYEVIHRNNRAGEADALFIDPKYETFAQAT